MSPKRVRRFQAQKVAPVAQHHVSFKGQLGKQSCPEFCSRLWLADDKGARCAYVHDIVFAQLLCENAGAKCSVSANIDAPKEDNESHTPDYEEKSQDALWRLRFSEAIGVELAAIFEMVRRTRNEAGHPTGKNIERQEAEALLLLLPTHIKALYAVIEWLKTTKL